MDNTILWTRQHHKALKAGNHYDYRLVKDGVAYSWATRKMLPEPGKSILLFRQPTHSIQYALTESGTIPKGQYGAGTFKLDMIQKAKLHPDSNDDKIKFTTSSGESFLVKKLENEKYGKDAWLFRNITPSLEKKANKYLEKIWKW